MSYNLQVEYIVHLLYLCVPDPLLNKFSLSFICAVLVQFKYKNRLPSFYEVSYTDILNNI